MKSDSKPDPNRPGMHKAQLRFSNVKILAETPLPFTLKVDGRSKRFISPTLIIHATNK